MTRQLGRARYSTILISKIKKTINGKPIYFDGIDNSDYVTGKGGELLHLVEAMHMDVWPTTAAMVSVITAPLSPTGPISHLRRSEHQ